MLNLFCHSLVDTLIYKSFHFQLYRKDLSEFRMNSTEKRALEYIRARLKRGASESDIRRELLAKNYSSELADKLLGKAKPKGKIFIFIIVGILILAAIAAAYFWLLPMLTVQSCADEACFITAADDCKTATFSNALAGSVFEYKTKNCILTKTLIQINETEPAEIRDLLEGKSMTCNYAKGNFAPELVLTISIGIEACQGELKDGIELLAVA